MDREILEPGVIEKMMADMEDEMEKIVSDTLREIQERRT